MLGPSVNINQNFVICFYVIVSSLLYYYGYRLSVIYASCCVY